MPFVSQAQRRFMYAKHPKIAAEFSAATPKGAKLPEKVKPSVDEQVKAMGRTVSTAAHAAKAAGTSRSEAVRSVNPSKPMGATPSEDMPLRKKKL